MRAGLAVLAALTVVAAAPRAQEFTLTVDVDGRPVCSLRGVACAGVTRPGGQGFARVELAELAGAPHDVRLSLATHRWDNGDVRIERSLALPANERTVLFLPMPTRMPSPQLTLEVDGVERKLRLGLGSSDGICGLLVADRADAVPAGLQRLQAMANSNDPPFQSLIAAAQAPTDWRLYTGFDVVQVDGRAAVTGELQESLRRALFAGVTVLVVAPEALPSGALQALLRAGVEAHGLGRLLAVSASASSESPTTRLFPVEAVLRLEAPIPGLGDAPVRVFLLVIVLFAVVAGPVNFLWLRRRKQPLLALVTVPVLGFSTTAAIVGFGFLHDGFGVHGVVQSWTWLDQGTHEAATWSSRTLFPGRAPGAFVVDADTLVVAPRATQRPDGAADRFHFDIGSTRLDGGVLPSRTPTPLVTVQQGIVRQRLVVQRDGNGLQVLGDGGVQPVGGVVLRDLDGGFWLGSGGHLTKADAVAARTAFSRLRREAFASMRLEVEETRWRRRGQPAETREVDHVVGELAERMLPYADLEPGGYVAVVARPPWLAEHGMQPTYDQERHLVRGRLAAADVR